MTGKWGEILGKLDLVRVREEFELSGFYFIFFLFRNIIYISIYSWPLGIRMLWRDHFSFSLNLNL